MRVSWRRRSREKGRRALNSRANMLFLLLVSSLLCPAWAQDALNLGAGDPLGPLNVLGDAQAPHGANAAEFGGIRSGAMLFPTEDRQFTQQQGALLRGSENGAIPFGRYSDAQGMAGSLSSRMSPPQPPHIYAAPVVHTQRWVGLTTWAPPPKRLVTLLRLPRGSSRMHPKP